MRAYAERIGNFPYESLTIGGREAGAIMKILRIVLIALVVLVSLGAATVYSGAFDVAADDPHWRVTSRVIESIRDRSIARRAKGVAPPSSLEDRQLITSGAGEYAQMCTGCHLAPGMKDTEMRKGLNPVPPELARHGANRTPGEQFWIIKHGLKMTAMPAWGLTHEDDRIWSMVAFLRKLPQMTSGQYQELVDSGEGGHHHDEGEGHSHDQAAAGDEKPRSGAALSGEAAEAAAVVDRFQRLLAQGKTRDASALLASDVLIFEGGGAERSRAEYASHHLNADSVFLKTANVAVTSRVGEATGGFAWIATESRLSTGIPKPLDLVTTETMLLKRTSDGWRVTHIHWSSKPK
jgi:mono/diheme cytochrome c family protein